MAESRSKTGQFLPGQSGNPGGRPKVLEEVRELGKAASPKIMRAFIKLALDEKTPAAQRIAAGNAVLDRTMGKPEQQHRVSGQINFAALLAEYTTQRLAVEQGEAEVLEGDDQDSLPGPNGNGAAEDQ